MSDRAHPGSRSDMQFNCSVVITFAPLTALSDAGSSQNSYLHFGQRRLLSPNSSDGIRRHDEGVLQLALGRVRQNNTAAITTPYDYYCTSCRGRVRWSIVVVCTCVRAHNTYGKTAERTTPLLAIHPAARGWNFFSQDFSQNGRNERTESLLRTAANTRVRQRSKIIVGGGDGGALNASEGERRCARRVRVCVYPSVCV